MKSEDVRKKFLQFFKQSPRNHKEISPAPLVLENDPTTLFTSSGMQPLVPYLMGKPHPEGKRLVNSQPSLRLQDIDEVGDNRHTTFFEMLGNWSLGDYFKSEQLAWFLEFLTKELKIPKENLWVSVFEGNDQVPKDNESAEIWRKLGIPNKKIFYYGVNKNWWSRSGTPEIMPVGEIGGPDSEIFYEFTQIKHDPKFGKECHPNCECGRFLEIGNSVFIQYKKVSKDKLGELPIKNVDFGGGLERITAVLNGNPDIFLTDLFYPIINKSEYYLDKKYEGTKNKTSMRIIADHMRASTFLISDGVEPSNKLQGYVLRRLLRRSMLNMQELTGNIIDSVAEDFYEAVIDGVLQIFKGTYIDVSSKREKIIETVNDEKIKFSSTLLKGLKIIESYNGNQLNGDNAFVLYESFGFPVEITKEIFRKKGFDFDEKKFDIDYRKAYRDHQELSKKVSAGIFKGGLEDHSPEIIKLHTATHLLLASLRKVLGEQVMQKGQNITKERSRFDFNNPKKLTKEQLEKVESMINEVIKKNLPVNYKVMPKEEALKTNAVHAFNEKYENMVKVYYVGEDIDNAYSKEFCGGPHVSRTGEIGRVRIKKQEKIGTEVIRIYITAKNG